MDHERIKNIKTGDVLLFVSDSIKAYFIQLATGFKWTHAGIAIRKNSRNEITLSSEGELYI